MEIGIATTPLSDIAQAREEVHPPVAWAAIFAGATAALAMSFVLSSLAAGLGLTLASPWPGSAPTLVGFTPGLGAAMIVVQVLSLALGGYLTGRLRIKWLYVHGHEVFFRDTAHGLLAWAVATMAGVALAALLGSSSDHAALADAAAADPRVAAQFSFFLGFGLLLGAFVASVAAAIGGLRRDEMHAKYRES